VRPPRPTTVQVLEYNATSASWSQLGDGTDLGTGMGVTLSADGTRLALRTGSWQNTIRVFEYVESAWVQVGAAITDEGGWALKLTGDGSRIAAGAFRSDGSGGFMLSGMGTTRVFDLAACGPAPPLGPAAFDEASDSCRWTKDPAVAGTVLTGESHSTVMKIDWTGATHTGARQWLLTLGHPGTGAEHWLWNGDNIQFGAWA